MGAAVPAPITRSAVIPVLTEAEFQPISRVKITPYPHREATLSRDRLLDSLRAGSQRRLSLIVAEAGYGKTTLLADFARRNEIRCLWYKLDSTDGDWVTFLNYLIASAREAWPEFGAQTAALLAKMAIRNPSRERVVSTFFAELSQAPNEPVLWIFDDFHGVDESDDVRDIIGRLVREAPDTVHLCLVTRRRPEMHLARLHAQGEIAQIDTQDMRFSLEETGRLFGEVYGQPLESDVLAQVDGRTEGWAASLQLLNSSIRGRSRTEIRTFVRAMTGAEGPLYDFLAEEVIGDLDPGLRSFLLHASILERITVDYAAAALERDGKRPSGEQITAWMAQAADLGLLSRP
ncbi:MAG: AAA family ATPase, partial [Chloroflexi bacterium]|nr:AAA family ATPase [Chloroflexota bacterium]